MQKSILIPVRTVAAVNVGVVMNEIITDEMYEVRNLIATTVATRNALKDEMEEWYARFPTERFIKLDNLIMIDGMLSELDSNYKRLWDFHNKNIAV